MIMLRPDLQDCASPKFSAGDLVRHVRYLYRGVVVAHDLKCLADENWYKSNKTQPDRNQPWYHVLVHDSGGLSTYVAQSNLEQDASGQAIDHPRTDIYFTKFTFIAWGNAINSRSFSPMHYNIITNCH